MAALPIAMIGATVLASAAGWASLYSSESERDSIQLQSGQHIRIQSRVRLSEEGKKNLPNSCLIASEDGTVTKIDIAGRKATVRCTKNRRAAPEEIPADNLEVIDSGVNAPGISIPGGYLTEGASVRMLDSSKRANRGKALASPFYNPVGTVLVIDKVQKQVVVLSQHLNNKSTAQEFYNIDDLEFVSGPSEAARTGAQAGLALKIGSTVELTDEAKKKYTPSIIASNLGSKSDNKKLADPKWEKFGIVKSITLDPKDKTKKIVIVRCVSKDSKKEVLEQKYDFADLKAIPAISVERAGIAVFGGMAEMDTKVKLRAERKSAVASKSLGRSAFGDMGTVSDLEPNDPNNLKIFVTCNGINPDEQTGDWYQPEDLEIAEPEDTEGEAVFGGRVVVGSTVRVMQSARGKKCLGTPEFGDVGTVKGIDPSAADNLKINVTCGRTDAKQSEWYDPRDLSLFFPMDESGSELEKAKVALADAQQKLKKWQLLPKSDSLKTKENKDLIEAEIKKAQDEVDRLSGVGLDKTKASEMRNDSEEKLDEAVKLKRELEAVRLKLSRDSTCKKPDRSKKYDVITEAAVLEWMENMFISPVDYKTLGTEPLQYSNSHRVAFAELQTAFQSLNAQTKDDATYSAYTALNAAKLALRKDLKSERSDTESFANLDTQLLEVAKKQNDFDLTASSPYKTALKTIDDKLKKLQEITTQIQSAAYSGDSPAEKLLKRVEELEKKTNDDITDNATDLRNAVTTYNAKFLAEQKARTKLDTDKYTYDQEVLGKKKPNPPAAITDDTIEAKLVTLENSRLAYLNAQKETLKARKEQALLSAKTTCSEITLESVNDMKSKIVKIISGKCGIVKTVDDLLDQVDTLISNRKRAFTMSQAVLDPKFGDPDNATFGIPIASPEDRIAEIEAAMTAIKSLEPSQGDLWKKLQTLIGLCGTYPGDTTLDEAKAIKEYPPAPPNNCPPNPGIAPAAPEGVKPKKPSRLNADAPEFVPPAAPGTPPMTPPGTPEESENDEPPPPPAVLNSRTNIEEWVTNEVTTKNYKQSSSSTQGAPNSELASSSYGVNIPPGWRIITTIGDGSCLIHAFLQALSPTYNHLSGEDKRKLAVSFRTYFQNKKPTNARGDLYTRKNSTEWLTDNEITDLSKEFNVITVIFDQQAKELQVSYGNYTLARGIPDNATVVFIHSDGQSHYQSVINPAGNTTEPYSTAIQTFTDNLIDIETRKYGGKRKWPFYGRRTTRRRGGALSYEQIQKISELAHFFNQVVGNKTSITIDEYAALASKRTELGLGKLILDKMLTQKNIRLPNENPPAPEPEPQEDGANPFRPPPPPPPAPLTQSQRFSNLVAQDEALPNMADDVPEVNPFASAPAPAPAQAPVRSQSQRFRDLAAGPQSRRAVNAPVPDVPEVNPFAPAKKSESQRFRDLVEQGRKSEEKARAKAAEDSAQANLDRTVREARATSKQIEKYLDEANKKFQKDTIAYNSLKAKWNEYEGRYKIWKAKRDLFDKCYAEYVAAKQEWIQKYHDWSDKVIKVAGALSSYQILRLQSRGVGSSLMLDEARKLMIDADAQQRTVMESKTDLQFTLASSSDADIAKAVGFYEAELQKLKTCISKGKDDAIAEYDKDLAEIEKKKKDITTKTFEVKAPQENQQGKKDYSKIKDADLPARLKEARNSLNNANNKLKTNPNDKNSQEQKKGAEARITGITAEFVKRGIPIPTPGGQRRMTMRRRRV